jgi:hypothetical protein
MTAPQEERPVWSIQAWVTHFIPQHDVNIGPGIEFLGVDFDGNIYAGEINRQRLVRYIPWRTPKVGGRGPESH